MYDEIDARPDPSPDRGRLMTERIRGEPLLNAKPPQAKSLATRIRAWQVDAAILDAHPHWYEDGRVAASGIAWGDAEDPKEVEVVKRKGKTVLAGGRGAKRPRVDRTGVESAYARIAEVSGGIHPDLIFADL